MSESNFFEQGINGAVQSTGSISESGVLSAPTGVVTVDDSLAAVEVDLPNAANHAGACVTLVAPAINNAITVISNDSSVVGQGALTAANLAVSYYSNGTAWYSSPTTAS
jgi:hypothetical protein